MIDLHCHYLPGVDDGARTMSEALALAAASVANGITTAVLTPHVHPGILDNSLSSLRPVFALFQAALREAEIPLAVHLGAEGRLHPGLFDLLAADELPLLGHLDGQSILLLEFPDGHIPVGALSACRILADRGIRPMIAHPERNKAIIREPSQIQSFVDIGCLLQVTAASVVGRFGPHAMRTADRLLAQGLVTIIATDAHNLAHRPPLLREAREFIRQRYGDRLAYRLTEYNAAAIITRSATDEGTLTCTS